MDLCPLSRISFPARAKISISRFGDKSPPFDELRAGFLAERTREKRGTHSVPRGLGFDGQRSLGITALVGYNPARNGTGGWHETRAV
jgi:hypothetical protein